MYMVKTKRVLERGAGTIGAGAEKNRQMERGESAVTTATIIL